MGVLGSIGNLAKDTAPALLSVAGNWYLGNRDPALLAKLGAQGISDQQRRKRERDDAKRLAEAQKKANRSRTLNPRGNAQVEFSPSGAGAFEQIAGVASTGLDIANEAMQRKEDSDLRASQLAASKQRLSQGTFQEDLMRGTSAASAAGEAPGSIVQAGPVDIPPEMEGMFSGDSDTTTDLDFGILPAAPPQHIMDRGIAAQEAFSAKRNEMGLDQQAREITTRLQENAERRAEETLRLNQGRYDLALDAAANDQAILDLKTTQGRNKARQDAQRALRGDLQKNKVLDTVEFVRRSTQDLLQGYQQNDALGDLTILKATALMQDPTGTVMQQEFETMAGAIGWFQARGVDISNFFDQDGRRLSEEGREMFLRNGVGLYRNRQLGFDSVIDASIQDEFAISGVPIETLRASSTSFRLPGDITSLLTKDQQDRGFGGIDIVGLESVDLFENADPQLMVYGNAKKMKEKALAERRSGTMLAPIGRRIPTLSNLQSASSSMRTPTRQLPGRN